jgi:hypothetical protein
VSGEEVHEEKRECNERRERGDELVRPRTVFQSERSQTTVSVWSKANESRRAKRGGRGLAGGEEIWGK